MSGDTLTHWLDCPDCSWAVLPSADGLWAEDRDPEHCVGCGALVRVLLDDGDPERAVARAALVERGGEVVARLLAEVDQAAYEADYTPPPGKVSDVARASITAAMAAEGSSCIEAGCVPAHTASEVLDAHDDANAEAERLTEDETERVQDARHAMRLARIDRAGLQTEAAHFKAQSKAAHADAVASANLSTAIANRRDTYKKERDKALGVVERLTAERDQGRMYVDKATEDAIAGTQLAIDAREEAARLREQLDREVAEVAAGAKDRDKMRRQFAETDARLRERVAAAESPERATAIIAAWLKLKGPMREGGGVAYAIGENLTIPEVRNGLDADGWRFLAGDFNTVDVGDLDLSDIHSTPTGATPSLTGPEYVAAVRESGLTPEDVEGIRGGVRRHRGVAAFFGTHSADYGAGYSAYMNGDMPGLGAIAAEWNAGYNDAKKHHEGEPGGES